MKKHGSATKRAFDELMSKSDAGAHRIGKDQNRLGITGSSPAPVQRRRGGNIETLSGEVPFREVPSRKAPSREAASGEGISREISSRAAQTAEIKRETVTPRKDESQTVVEAVSRPASAPASARPAQTASIPAAVRSDRQSSSAAPAPARKPAPAAVNPVIGKSAAPSREMRVDSIVVQKRTVAAQPAGAPDSQIRRDVLRHSNTAPAAAPVSAPLTKADAPVRRCPLGKAFVKRAAMGVAAAFAVIGVAVTVYAISSDKNDPTSPDVYIGGGAAKISDSLSSVSVLSSESIAGETGAETDTADIAAPEFKESAELADSDNLIDSRFTVTFTFYQEESVVCSTPETTVGALMERLGITAGDGKRMYVSADDVISGDTEIRIDTVEYKTEYGTEAVAFSTEYQDVRTIPRGSTKVYRGGKNGVKTVEYLCEYVNGELTNKETKGESITTAPTSQIMYRGVGGTIAGRSYSYYIDVKATTYTGGGITASGLPANESVIAVDPSVIPLGTKVYVTGSYGDFGVRTAADTGGSIKGNKIDVYLDSSNPYFGNFGWRNMRVYILG